MRNSTLRATCLEKAACSYGPGGDTELRADWRGEQELAEGNNIQDLEGIQGKGAVKEDSYRRVIQTKEIMNGSEWKP